MAATTRVRVLVAGVAVVVSAAGAVLWSRAIVADEAPDAVLDEPGVYVEPGAPTNPPLPSADLPDVPLLDAAGREVVLAPDGRPMVVNLWYSTCAPCARELADFADVHAEVGDEVRFVGVNPVDAPDVMTRFAGDRGVAYELLRDDGARFADALGVAAFPVTLFVGADGAIVDSTGVVDDAELRSRIAELWP